MKKVVHHLNRTTRFLLIGSTVVLALVLSVARLLLPAVEDYREELEQQLAERVGKPVSITRLGAHMKGFYPELVLSDVAVDEGKKEVARLSEIRVGLSLKSLLEGSPRPLWISLVGAELTVIRGEDGKLSIYGLGSDKEEKAFPEWLFSDGRFEIIDSTIFWQNLKLKSPMIELNHVAVSLLNDGDRHQIEMRTNLPRNKGQDILARLDYYGDLLSQESWRGQFYLEGNGLYPAEILEGEPLGPVSVRDGLADLKIWGALKGGEFQSAQGAISLENPSVEWQPEVSGSVESIKLDALSSLFRATRLESGWKLSLIDLTVDRFGEPEAWNSDWTVVIDPDQIRLAGSALNLGDLGDELLSRALLPASMEEALAGLKPSGRLADFSAIVQRAEEGVRRSWFCGRFNELKMEAWRKIPGVENFEGRLCGSDQQGFVELGTGDAQVNIAALFRTPWQVSNSQGRIYWQSEEKSWRLFSPGFQLETPDITGAVIFALDAEEGEAPFLSLQGSFGQGKVEGAGHYYPTAIMPRKTLAWLDRALVSGTVPDGGVLFHGPLKRFPFRESEGVFEVLFDADDVTLDYQKGWPAATGVGAEVRFFQDELKIAAHTGNLEGAKIESANVEILGLRRPKWLEISGNVTGDVRESLAFLQKSPLHDRVDPLMKVMDAQGANKISLNLKIPLKRKLGSTLVKGSAVISQGNINVRGIDLKVDNVRGVLDFSEEGISSEKIEALVLKEPVSAKLVRGKKAMLLKAAGSAAIADLARQFPTAVWPYLSGKTNYDLLLEIPLREQKQSSTRLTIKSDTEGVALKLPPPYGKKSHEKRDFLFSMPLEGGGSSLMEIRYADLMRAGLLFSDPGSDRFGLLKGELRLDSASPVLPEKGLRLAGKLARFDLDQWQDIAESPASSGKQQDEAVEQLRELDFRFDAFVAKGKNYGAVDFQLKRGKGAWQGDVSSSRFGQGFVRLPDELHGEAPLEMDLELLKIPPQGEFEGIGSDEKPFDPDTLPNLKIKSKRLVWQGKELGGLVLETRKMADGVQVNRVSILSEKDRLESKGNWRLDNSGNYQTTLGGRLESEEIGELIERLEISRELVAEEGAADFSLRWTGAPWDLDVSSLNGDFGMKIGKGRLLNLEPGVGRLLGLLSLKTLQRRLTLDFSDLFSKGFSFDKIEADYKVADGDSYTGNFFLDGPVARVDIEGRMGLVDRDYEQLIVVTPRTTASLPLAGAIAGGPVVGAAVFVAQKVIGGRVEKVTRSRYELTGSWENPKLMQLGQDKPWSKRMLDRVWTGLSGQEPEYEKAEQ